MKEYQIYWISEDIFLFLNMQTRHILRMLGMFQHVYSGPADLC